MADSEARQRLQRELQPSTKSPSKAEHGLDIASEILDEIEKKYSVYIYETDENNSF